MTPGSNVPGGRGDTGPHPPKRLSLTISDLNAFTDINFFAQSRYHIIFILFHITINLNKFRTYIQAPKRVDRAEPEEYSELVYSGGGRVESEIFDLVVHHYCWNSLYGRNGLL